MPRPARLSRRRVLRALPVGVALCALVRSPLATAADDASGTLTLAIENSAWVVDPDNPNASGARAPNRTSLTVTIAIGTAVIIDNRDPVAYQFVSVAPAGAVATLDPDESIIVPAMTQRGARALAEAQSNLYLELVYEPDL